MNFFQSLKFKTLVLIFCIFGISVFLFSILLLKTDFEHAEHHLITHAKKMAENQTEGLSVALWYFDTNLVQQIVNSWKHDPDVYKIIVRNTSGKIIAQLNKEQPEELKYKSFVDWFIDDNFVTIQKPIKYQKKYIGDLEFTVSKKRIYLDTFVYIKRGLWLIFILFIMIFIWSYVGVSLLITRPLVDLLKSMMKISNGDFASPIHYTKRKDEIGVMAKGLLVFKENSKIRKELEKEKYKQEKEQRSKELEYLESLKEQKEKAESANIAKSEFLANMSHELRTPLNGVLGMLSALEEGKLTKEQKENVKIARSSGNSLLVLINDILDFSKIESGNISLKHETFNLKDLLRDIYNIVYFQVQEKNLEIEFYYDEAIPNLMLGDEFRLKQILLNLINNAVKFTNSGKVIVVTKLKGQNRDNFRLNFYVTDTGLGIRKEDVQKLFKKFSQLESTDTKNFAGTGLGLAIAQKLAHMMGGDIKVSSTHQKGSIFCVTANFSTIEAIDLRSHYSYFKPHSALVILEDRQERSELVKTLKAMGYNTEGFHNLEAQGVKDFENKAELEESSIDYVFVDAGLLGDEGVSNIKKEHPAFGQVIDLSRHNIFFYKDSQAFIDPIKFVQLMLDSLNLNLISLDSKQKDKQSKIKYKISSSARNILVAEDNKINQLVVAKFLEKYGFNIDFAEDGQEAIDLYKENDYDLIFMDCQMPRVDGFQATKEIQKIQLQTTKRSIIVALTARAFTEGKQECIDAGMDDYILKPIDSQILDKILLKWGLIK